MSGIKANKPTQNKVELLNNGIIYVKKVGDQDAQSFIKLNREISKIAKKLRTQGKPVLILVNSKREGSTDLEGWMEAEKVGRSLDFNRSASYGTSPSVHVRRQYIARELQKSQKIVDFDTREEAERWLLN